MIEENAINDSGILVDVEAAIGRTGKKQASKRKPLDGFTMSQLRNSKDDLIDDVKRRDSDELEFSDSGLGASPATSEEISVVDETSVASNSSDSKESLYENSPPDYKQFDGSDFNPLVVDVHRPPHEVINLEVSNENFDENGRLAHKAVDLGVSNKNFDENGSTSSSSSDVNVDRKCDEKTQNGVESSSETLGITESCEPLLNSTVKPDKEKQKSRSSCCIRGITTAIGTIKSFFRAHEKSIMRILKVIFILFNVIWLSVALIKDVERSMPFLCIFCLVLFFSAYSFIKERIGDDIVNAFSGFSGCYAKCSRYVRWFACFVAVCCMILWIYFDTRHRFHQLVSLVGYFVFLLILFVISKTPEDVNWTPVIWGCAIQIILGLFILRTSAGFSAFDYLGNLVQEFLGFVKKGCIFVFGSNYEDHFFAFSVLPIIIFFSSFISVMYHFGAMQWLITKIAWLMQISLGTSATESMVAAGNIFVGQTESPLLIRPYIKDLTTSELHAVMTAGFGTIAGSVLGAYMGFGIKPVYVITACVMAAPCALAVSKLLYPETEESKFKTEQGLDLESSGYRNVIEAAFVGASQAIPLVLNIGANLIAFIALLTAINAFLNWYGSLVDIENLSFELICSYIFVPFSYLMGVEWQDCFKCAELIGTKIFLNEFIAYEKLSGLIDNRKNNTLPRYNETTDEIYWISERSEAIITYALCGFANLSSVGIVLGGLGAMCPERQSEMAKIILRALTGGVFVSLLNACIAGFFYVPDSIDCDKVLSLPWEVSELNYVYQCCSDATSTNSTNFTMQCCNATWPSGYSTFEAC